MSGTGATSGSGGGGTSNSGAGAAAGSSSPRAGSQTGSAAEGPTSTTPPSQIPVAVAGSSSSSSNGGGGGGATLPTAAPAAPPQQSMFTLRTSASTPTSSGNSSSSSRQHAARLSTGNFSAAPGFSSASASASASSSSSSSTSAGRRASTSMHHGSPARSRLGVSTGGVQPTSHPSNSAGAASSSSTIMLPSHPSALSSHTASAGAGGPSSLGGPATSAPSTSSAQLTAAQALAQQPSVSSHVSPSIFGGLYASSPEVARAAQPGSSSAAGPSNPNLISNAQASSSASSSANNPSTRILSSANLSTPVPSSASSSATFLTGRSQAATSSSQTVAAASHSARAGAAGGSHFAPLGGFTSRHAQGGGGYQGGTGSGGSTGAQGSGSNTPIRAGVQPGVTLMPGLPLPLSFGLASNPNGSPRIPSSQHHTGIYTHNVYNPVGIFAAGAVAAGSSAQGLGQSSRASPTPRNMPIGGFPSTSTITPAMVGGVPGSTSSPNGLGTFPAWYRHPTSGLLPLLEVPSAFLSGGSANAGRPISHSRTGSTSALLRSSAALTSGTGRTSAGQSSSANLSASEPHTPNPLHAGPILGGAMSEDTVVSFSWVIGELALLRDEVERSMPPGDEGRSVSAGAGRNPVWTTQPCFGDPKLPKWKLELVRTQRNRPSTDEDYLNSSSAAAAGMENVGMAGSGSEARSAPGTPGARSEGADTADTPRADATTVLSVYLTSLALEYLPSDALIPATIMIGLQPARTTLSRLQSRAGGWIWQEYSSFVFKREYEFFECHSLPTLSELLENDEVRAQDAVKLTVQIGCGPGIVGPETDVGEGFEFGEQHAQARAEGPNGTGPSNGLMLAPFPRLAPFQVPSAHYVSQTILDALEGLVDCARTGDVRIIVRERGLLIQPPQDVGMDTAMSDDGHSYGANAETERLQQQQQQPYVIPYPVGSYFPIELAEAERQEQQMQLELSGMLPAGSASRSAPPLTSVVVRDRIIWAHSSVLRARSQYFADMIDGGFAEAQDATTNTTTTRAIKTFRIPDSEWATVYWLIRYLYLEEIEFADREDVRSAALDNEWMISAEGLFPSDASAYGDASGVGGGGGGADVLERSSHGLSRTASQPNWEWRTIGELLQEEEELRGGAGPGAQAQAQESTDSDVNVTTVDNPPVHAPTPPAAVASSSSSSSKLNVPSSPSGSWRGHPGTIYSSSHPPPKSHAQGESSSSSSGSAISSTHSLHSQFPSSSSIVSSSAAAAAAAEGAERGGGTGTSTASTTPVPHGTSSFSRSQPLDPNQPPTATANAAAASSAAAASPTFNDPHEHPAARAPPASALATYKLAHRYGQAGLAELAKAHIVETLTPQSAFPVLLATALYAGLHEAIKRYVYEHWEEVSHTEEFERCCDEVGAGEWGAEAGRSLRIFMQSLLSPARILLASPQR
ncbi:hypothetical protein OC835_005554 [Tilletia horrida]|nr:hypothetical protein OC835_005554 [Tilletia horrida]KAK0564935.1 hypothetical protein OC844_001458 [Tilletia horrida]